MITLRPSAERGHFDHGWLDTRHTFSFAGYQDPAHMGFRHLRVINEDVVQPDHGFGTHPHRDMEIVTYVLEGALEHRDSMGNTGVIGAGEVQRMTAGTGITHSEYNASGSEPVHLMQIWITPAEIGLTPSYEQHALLDPGAGSGASAAARLRARRLARRPGWFAADPPGCTSPRGDTRRGRPHPDLVASRVVMPGCRSSEADSRSTGSTSRWATARRSATKPRSTCRRPQPPTRFCST